MKDLGKDLRDFGKNLSFKVTAPLALLGGVAVRTFVKFEKSMLKVKARVDQTGGSFEGLTELAEKLGRTTVFTAGQAAEAMAELTQLGVEANTIFKVLPKVLDLAAAGNLDLADSAKTVIGIMNGMQIGVQDVGNVVDVLAKASVTSAADVQALGDAFKKVGPVAKQAGIKLTTITAMVQILKNVSLEGAEAGTAIRNIISRLGNTSSVAGKKLKAMGVVVADELTGKLKQPRILFDEITNAMNRFGLTTVEQGTLISQLVGERMKGAFFALAEVGGAGLDKLTAKLGDVEGTAAEIAKTQIGGLFGAFKLLNSAIEGVELTIGKILEPTLNAIASRIVKLTQTFQSLSPFLQKSIVAFAAVAAAIGPVTFALGALVAIFPAVVTGFALVKVKSIAAGKAIATFTKATWAAVAANTALIGPILLGIATLALVANVVSIVVANWDVLVEAFTDGGKILGQILQNVFNDAKMWLVDRFKPIFTFFALSFSALSEIIGGWLNSAKKFYRLSFIAAKKWLVDKLLKVINKAIGFFNKLAVLWGGSIEKLKNFKKIKAGAEEAAKILKLSFDVAYKGLEDGANEAKKAVVKNLKLIKVVGKVTGDTIKNTFKNAFEETQRSAKINFEKIKKLMQELVFRPVLPEKLPGPGAAPAAAGAAPGGVPDPTKLDEIKDKNKVTVAEMIEDWARFSKESQDKLEDFGALASQTFQAFSQGFADAVADSIIFGESFADAMERVFKDVAKQIISALIQIGIQRLVTSALTIATSKVDMGAQVADAAAITFARAFFSRGWDSNYWPSNCPCNSRWRSYGNETWCFGRWCYAVCRRGNC